MLSFRSNPMVITSEGIPCQIVELSLELENQDFSLEILDSEGRQIQKVDVDETTLISLDKNYGEVKLLYWDAKGSLLQEHVLDLSKGQEAYHVEATSSDLEIALENLVKSQMDFPTGTPTEISNHTEMLKKATMDRNARLYVTSKIRNILVSSNMLSASEIEPNVYKIFSNLYGMGVLQELDDNERVGEIMVNASVFPTFKSDIYYIQDGAKYRYEKGFRSLDELKQVFSRAVSFNKKELNSVENAIIEATRANKDRVNVLIPEASENYVLNIRKFSNFVPNLDMMRRTGTVDEDIERLMKAFVKGKANIGIGGEMGTGKTTFINFLLTYTDPIERKVVIASVSETDVERVLKGHDVVILNVNEEKDFTFDKLIRASLRTTASRIIIPESRGGEFKQVYEANLKTKGNMFTAHALDDISFLDMCVDMYLSSGETTNENSEYIRDKLAKSIDVVVVMRKVGDKIRIKSISEVLLDERRNFAGMNPLYVWEFDPEDPSEGYYKATGNHLSEDLKKRLNENGVPMSELRNL